jgi:hypothetical protein
MEVAQAGHGGFRAGHGVDNHMIAGNRASSISTPSNPNRTMPRPCLMT